MYTTNSDSDEPEVVPLNYSLESNFTGSCDFKEQRLESFGAEEQRLRPNMGRGQA